MGRPSDGTTGYEDTAYSWRRVSRVPRALRFLGRVIAWPFRFLYRKLKGPPNEPGA